MTVGIDCKKHSKAEKQKPPESLTKQSFFKWYRDSDYLFLMYLPLSIANSSLVLSVSGTISEVPEPEEQQKGNELYI